MGHDYFSYLRNQDGVHPVLLSPPPPLSAQDALCRLPAAVLGPVIKQLQRLLCAGNQHLGRPFLSGNFAPVHKELHATQLPLVTATSSGSIPEKAGVVADAQDTDSKPDQVHLVANSSSTAPAPAAAGKLFGAAELPAGLSGAFLRIGPNPLLPPMGGYHWFDGDGMMHAVRIKDGAASYCNRWVPTSRLAQEHGTWPLFMKLGDYVGLPALALLALHRVKRWLGVVDTSAGTGTANTAMVAHASRLLALHEGDLPHAMRLLCDGLLEAVGRVMVSQPAGKSFKSFTAHPKLDPHTGELHFFSYNFDAAPYVSYGVLGPQGELQAALDIGAGNIRRPVMMHDFAITQNWAVFMDHPLCFDGERMVKERNLPFKFQPEQGSRVGLLPRGASDDSGMLWFDLPPHMVFHVANAWEEPDGTVKLFVCHSESISLNLDTRTAGDIPQAERPRLAVVTLDPTASGRQGSLRLMTTTAGDFPTINPAFVGRKNRFCYVATMVTGFGAAVKWDGVAKMDLWAAEGSDAVVGRIKLPDNCFNGETVFVPRYEDASRCASEDDGYLVTFVQDEDAGSSSLVVWDALSMEPQPVAVVALPQRVPYGFHGLWLTERQVQEQLRGAALQPRLAAAPAAE